MVVKRLPISLKKFEPSSFIGPRVSTAMATKSYLCLTPVYFEIFRSEASSAEAPLTADVTDKCDIANVSGIVTSQVIDLPRCHGISVHPSTNLNFISKILEKVVASRTQSHLSSNSLSSSFQSAYRIFHSTETTLLKIHNDLILAMDRGKVTSLILLDLSAAFDTVDYSILLTRLQNWFGLDGLSLNWFTSYLSSRSQAVSINDSISAFSTLSCGVPQGSVLGPLLFTLYTTPLGSVI